MWFNLLITLFYALNVYTIFSSWGACSYYVSNWDLVDGRTSVNFDTFSILLCLSSFFNYVSSSLDLIFLLSLELLRSYILWVFDSLLLLLIIVTFSSITLLTRSLIIEILDWLTLGFRLVMFKSSSSLPYILLNRYSTSLSLRSSSIGFSFVFSYRLDGFLDLFLIFETMLAN